MRTILMLVAVLAIPPAMGADYERERRWAEEIVPGIVVGDPVYLQTGGGRRFLALYTEAPGARAAVIVVHGGGIHPDMGLIGVLRTRLADQGYTTLSIQMPVLSAEAKGDDYLPEFPEARERLSAAVKYLREKKQGKIALVSHSLGSRMSSDYLKHNPAAPLFAWVAVSLTYDTMESLAMLRFPVLDLYGERDLPQVMENNAARARVVGKLKGSAQIMTPGADHFFENLDDALVGHVKHFLDRALAGGRGS